MKKFTALFICAVMLVAMCSIGVNAAASTGEAFNIPKAATAPTINGVIDGDEWDGALTRVLTADNVDDPTGANNGFEGATFYWMWDDAGMYVYIDAKDTTASAGQPAGGTGSYNSGDGAQVCIYTSGDIDGSAHATLFFFSLCPYADDGNCYIGEHFVYGTDSAGANVDDAKIAAVDTDAGYTIEAFISKEAFAKSEPAIVIAEGCVLPLANIIMNSDGSSQSLFTDTAWFSGINSNKYTLVSDPAGHIDVPVEEIAADETPAAADTTDTAPVAAAAQTSDMIVVSAVAAVLALGCAFIAVKRK